MKGQADLPRREVTASKQRKSHTLRKRVIDTVTEAWNRANNDNTARLTGRDRA